jgi:hypothetical protein
MVSWPRRVLRNVTVHDSSVVIFVLNLIRYTRCSTSQISQAMKPLNSKGPTPAPHLPSEAGSRLRLFLGRRWA